MLYYLLAEISLNSDYENNENANNGQQSSIVSWFEYCFFWLDYLDIS